MRCVGYSVRSILPNLPRVCLGCSEAVALPRVCRWSWVCGLCRNIRSIASVIFAVWGRFSNRTSVLCQSRTSVRFTSLCEKSEGLAPYIAIFETYPHKNRVTSKFLFGKWFCFSTLLRFSLLHPHI